MIFSGKTDRGKVRKSNQDDFAVGELSGGAVFAVVCDGMGGANGGNIASSSAVKIISENLKQGFDASLKPENIKLLIIDSINMANDVVFEKSRNDTALFGMGTTVVVMIAASGKAFIAHAGDSRAYLINDEIKKLTRDHSIVQEMLENGKITPEEALVHPQKNIITRALGVEGCLNIDYCVQNFNPGCSVLICTDGLTNLVSDSEIYDVIKHEEPEQSVNRLIDMANLSGGSDNITVVIIHNAQTGSEING
ncbi:MAG TPA: Stp1/IreP family PP2C-type Ser/Thr phosphatase [Ruminiclostridium sp.]|nr:Stp1/IreP family PP2C-type Ser/Thr phosphatase [Ruminiclostridium sp.]